MTARHLRNQPAGAPLPAGTVAGLPRRTRQRSVEELEAAGIVGVYAAPDVPAAERPRRGRPQAYDCVLPQLRVTTEQRDALDRLTQSLGLRSRADALRWLAERAREKRDG